MYVRTYVCMYVCVYIYIYIYIYTHTYTYTHNIYTYTWLRKSRERTSSRTRLSSRPTRARLADYYSIIIIMVTITSIVNSMIINSIISISTSIVRGLHHTLSNYVGS